MKKRTALALYSGGLDSILASKLVASLGINVICVKFVTPFFDYELLQNQEAYKQEVLDEYGLNVVLYDLSKNYLELLHNPSHGFGKNFNPCIDCKILMCTRIKEMMNEYDASFLISGEVLGQRPMSQRRDTLRVIERDSDNEGVLLRPLSAKLMTPTFAETEGWVDREKLLDFSGRGRSRQIQLAKDFGIKNFPTPAGGCTLADPILSDRIEKIYKGDFIVKAHDIRISDIRLLLVGRQFEVADGGWLVLGRNEQENRKIELLAEEGDLLLHMPEWPGPTALLRGVAGVEVDVHNIAACIQGSADLVVRYGKKISGKTPEATVEVKQTGTDVDPPIYIQSAGLPVDI
jgi:tRNA-uridine 2-sulfurtransferase